MIISNNKLVNVLQQKAALFKNHSAVKRFNKKYPKVRFSTIVVYSSVFLLILTIVFTSYQSPKKPSALANAANPQAKSQVSVTSVDGVVASNLAANVAQAADLPIANEVANLAVSIKVNNDMIQQTGIFKPQVVGSSVEGRSVTSYTAQSGDTVDILAERFALSKNTIKWANNLTRDSLYDGQVLQILPIDGVIHEVKANETIDSIAEKYEVDKDRLVLYNDLDVSGLVADSKVILPNATLPNNERPGYIAPAAYNYFSYSSAGFGGGKTWYISSGTPTGGPYAYGNCTLYAYNRRVQLGRPVGGAGGLHQWGNAGTWAGYASALGLQVDHTPGAGAVMASYGHVAIVEEVLPNGDINISEMNAHVSGGGYNIVSGRTVSAREVGQYWYIH